MQLAYFVVELDIQLDFQNVPAEESAQTSYEEEVTSVVDVAR